MIVIRKYSIVPIALLTIIVVLSVSGCSSGGSSSPTATPSASVTPTPAPTPTPEPVYSFTPAAKTWPINVTGHTYILYKRTNNVVAKDKVNYQSWDYIDLAVNNTTTVQRLVYNNSQEGRGTSTIYQFFFAMPSGSFINGSRWTVANGDPGGATALKESDVMGIDLRKASDWRCTREWPRETVTVPAGTFDSSKYVTMYYDNVTSAIWMADYVPAPVKREMYNNGSVTILYELQAYQMGGKSG
jgi:hypothetical protein